MQSTFNLSSDYQPTGDQPYAIAQLVEGIHRGDKHQTLLGVTGSGKTFTIANVIANVNKPALVLSHNKTLAAQLYGEFKQFFPENAVEYFVSYYDYYQPEAYLPVSNLYIEKDLSINEQIDKLRLSATSALLSGRRDVIVVASVSCIYGIGNPEEFGKNVIRLSVSQKINRNQLLFKFVDILYSRTADEFKRGTFRVKGDTVDVYPAYADFAYRIFFFGDEIEAIHRIDPESGKRIIEESAVALFPANLFVTGKDVMELALTEIQNDLSLQTDFFEDEKRAEEAKRIKQRTEFDVEMMKELGYCSGIENYSRYFDRRKPGERPFCLLNYFPQDFLMIIDESHATIPQVKGMWGGDRSRKINLVDYGFRLPAALDNRPLTFNEFESLLDQVIYVSATPADHELQRSEGVIVEQIIRPTGLLDPEIDVRPSTNQIDDLLEEIDERIKVNEKVLITTLTKRMAEELATFLDKINIKCRYIHSEVHTLDRVEILRELRLGIFDVLVGVNLLREGLDLPEVSLVAILDADKEGFLRNQRSLIQTIGRAARNKNGKVLLYADTVTGSMQKAIDETNRRRMIQQEYNSLNNITPETIFKTKEEILEQTMIADVKKPFLKRNERPQKYYTDIEPTIAADPVVAYMSKIEIKKLVDKTQKQMAKAAKELDFLEAARLRDDFFELKKML
ncbi:MAG: excinuclease ABC subunit UvrB [Cytophagales bacterium]|nr:excinuclease ABC subunit UvrB [Cytophagales bacterium]